MKDYAKELADMSIEFDALCKKYNHTGLAVVMEGKGEFFLSSVNSNTNEELVELITRGYDTLVGAMFTAYGNDKLKEARDLLGDKLNRKYSYRLQQKDRAVERKDGRIRGVVVHEWTDKGLLLIRGDDGKRYVGHWNFSEKGVMRVRKVYFIPGEPELLPDGTPRRNRTALDVKKFNEL